MPSTDMIPTALAALAFAFLVFAIWPTGRPVYECKTPEDISSTRACLSSVRSHGV